MELDLNFCNSDAETCPVVRKCIDYDEFAKITQELNPNAQFDSEMLGDFVTSCVLGTCPGQNIEATKEALRQFIKNHK